VVNAEQASKRLSRLRPAPVSGRPMQMRNVKSETRLLSVRRGIGEGRQATGPDATRGSPAVHRGMRSMAQLVSYFVKAGRLRMAERLVIPMSGYSGRGKGLS